MEFLSKLKLTILQIHFLWETSRNLFLAKSTCCSASSSPFSTSSLPPLIFSPCSVFGWIKFPTCSQKISSLISFDWMRQYLESSGNSETESRTFHKKWNCFQDPLDWTERSFVLNTLPSHSWAWDELLLNLCLCNSQQDIFQILSALSELQTSTQSFLLQELHVRETST